ncbi:MAG: hypothetical protein U9O20_01000 [Patescibacteria group bacterium]|nr:hypothetical protein [Patescibacteria group bacterium]
MSKITDFLRKIGLLHVSKGDSEFDSREDLKKPEEQKSQEVPAQEVSSESELDSGDQDALENK